MASTLFTNVQVFEGTKSKLMAGEVLVQGNRIKAVSRAAGKIPQQGVDEVIDCGGATLMPGMINAHCHFTYNNATSIEDITALQVEEHMLVTMQNAATYLDYGFTAVVGMASAKPRLEIVARNAIDAGHYPGPRIRACTPEYTVTGGLGDGSRLDRYIPSIGVVCDGAEAFRQSVRALIREGVDIVKLNISGDSFLMGRLPGDTNPMTDDEVRAICETTLNLGKRVAAHAHADGGVLQCMEYGIEFINHATFASPKTIEKLARVADKHWVTPAIAARYNTTYEAADWGITTEVAEMIGNKRELEVGAATMTAMHKAGIRILPFGDYGFAWLPIGTDARDLVHMVELFGMKPHEALRAATAYGGEAWAGASGELLGRVQKGYLADLLIVDGDPLSDLTILQDRERITAVMKDGQFHRRPAAGERFVQARSKRRKSVA